MTGKASGWRLNSSRRPTRAWRRSCSRLFSTSPFIPSGSIWAIGNARWSLGGGSAPGMCLTLETARGWARLYVAAILAGEPVDAADFELSYVEAAGQGFGAALDVRFMLVDALVASNRLREGGRLYRRALHLAGVLGDSARLDRIIAATSNNMAWELHELSSRTADENDLMRLSAETSLGYWLKCGNWINAEGAHYLNAIVANAIGDSRSGLDHADAALAIIAANGERPLDAAQLHLARAASLAALGDALGTAEAMRSADAAAAKLQPELKARFDSVRAKAVAGSA